MSSVGCELRGFRPLSRFCGFVALPRVVSVYCILKNSFLNMEALLEVKY